MFIVLQVIDLPPGALDIIFAVYHLTVLLLLDVQQDLPLGASFTSCLASFRAASWLAHSLRCDGAFPCQVHACGAGNGLWTVQGVCG